MRTRSSPDAVDLEHGFTRVDRTERPAAWVDCLDMLAAEPFYRDYKSRVRALLAPTATGLYLEIGAGTGADAMRMEGKVIAVDRSLTMCREAHVRGLGTSIVADAEALPLSPELVDGCWADRVFQHLVRPDVVLRELARVMKPGATIVIVDPDYATQAMAFPDQALAEKVLSFRAQHLLRNGTIAHEMAGHLLDLGFYAASAEDRRLVVNDPTAIDNVMGLRSWARIAAQRSIISQRDALRWEELYDDVVAGGTFSWSVSFFITSARKPPHD